MKQTIVAYGEGAGAVEIYHCLTTSFEQREERDPSSVDTLFQRITITVEGYCHGKAIIGDPVRIYPAAASGSAGSQYALIRRLLGEPRHRFRYIAGADSSGSGGTTVLDISQQARDGHVAADIDVSGGPRCTHFNVQHVVGDELWKVSATFEVCLPTCAARIDNDSRVLSNRWSVTDMIDRDRMTTRTYNGRLRVSGGVVNPNSFRAMVVPLLVKGMRRDSMTFTATEDGLWLEYTIVDREVAYSAPKPATTWDIHHTERSGPDGKTGEGDISVSLTGDRDVDRKQLIALGLKVLKDRLYKKGDNALSSGFLMNLAVSDFSGSEGPLRVVVSGMVKHQARQGAGDDFKDLIFASDRIGTPINISLIGDYDRHTSLDGRAGETPQYQGAILLTGAFVTYLQTVCRPEHSIGEEGTLLYNGGGPGGRSPSISATVAPDLPDRATEYLDPSVTDSTFYYESRAEARYETSHHRIVMPVAYDPSAAGGTSQSGGGTSAPRDTVAIISMAPPSTMRRMRAASRIGKEPEFPEPVDQYIDGSTVAKLLRTVVLPTVAERLPDGKQIYRAEVEYHYALTRPATATDKLRIGVNPWEKSGLYRSTEHLLGKYTEEGKS